MKKNCKVNGDDILTITEKVQKMLSETAEEMLDLAERFNYSCNEPDQDDKELVRMAAIATFSEMQRVMKMSFVAGDRKGIDYAIGELREIVEICE